MKKIQKYDLYIYLAIAYIFSIACRLIWVYQFSDIDYAYWHGQLMINTNDGYYFGTAIKNLLFHSNTNNPILPMAVDTYPGTIYSIYFLAKVLPFSLDTIMLYAPTFISSLIVIPIILILRLFKLTSLGFFAALIASVTWSFYNRTMTGYFDTDMYALVFPMFILYFMIKFLLIQDIKNILIASFLTSFYVVFYPQGYVAIGSLFFIFIIYNLIFDRKNIIFYQTILLFSIALIKIPLILKLILFTISFIFFKKFKNKINFKQYIYIAIASIVIFLLFSNVFSLILSKVSWYTTTGVEGGKLHFYDVAQTIREAGKIPFDIFAKRISGSIITFILSIIGYILLVLRKKEFLLFLPLIAIGFFAYIGGLRFTVYAIPAMAIGIVYLFYTVLDILLTNKPSYGLKLSRQSQINILIAIATSIVLYPNIKHIIGYTVSPVFIKKEVQVLDKLKNISNSKDYTLAWWDYGYPIWYYSNTNTLIDGGKHHHDNFIISQILTTSSPVQVVNLGRLAVETYIDSNLIDVNRSYVPVANLIFKGKNPNDFLEQLKKPNFILPKKTRDIYLYLPNRMLNIFPTIDLFSNLNLETGQKKYNTFFYVSKRFKIFRNLINFSNGISIDTQKGVIILSQERTIPIGKFTITAYDKNNKLRVITKTLDENSKIHVIFMKNYRQMILLDDRLFHSTFIQMFVLEHYDKNLFKPIILTPLVKIYKLRK